MKPEGLLPCSKGHAIDLYPGIDESIAYPYPLHTLFKIHFNIFLPSARQSSEHIWRLWWRDEMAYA
jgi:hypothetical protein